MSTVSVSTLPNGVTIIFAGDQQGSMASVALGYIGGSVDDRKLLGGEHHHLEHMYFHDNRANPRQDSLAWQLEEVCSTWNAWTTKTNTSLFGQTIHHSRKENPPVIPRGVKNGAG